MKKIKITRSITTYQEEEVPETLESFKTWRFTSSCTVGQDFKRFQRLFKNNLKKNLSTGLQIVNFINGHYFLGGFVTNGTRYVYFSISDVRFFPLKWANHILIRTAKNENDYTGGKNQYTTLKDFAKNIESLLKG